MKGVATALLFIIHKVLMKYQGRKAVIQLNTVPRNSKGGIAVTDEDIVAAFEFFGHKNGRLTRNAVIKTFKDLCKNISKNDINIIFADKDEISVEEVKSFLENNTIATDPIRDAFHVLDPTNCGYIAEERLKKIFANFEYGELNDEELKFLIQNGDYDGDGKITLSDFLKLARPEIRVNPVKSGTGFIPDVDKLKRLQTKKKNKQSKDFIKVS